MSPDGAHRLEDILALLDEEELQVLADHFESRPNISELRDLLQPSPEALSARVDELDEETLATLYQLAAMLPPHVVLEENLSPELVTLLQNGFAYPLAFQAEHRLHIPLEVQLLLHARRPLTDPDLRILLLERLEECPQLEEIYLSDDEEAPEDDLHRVSRLADAMESLPTLRELYKSLPEAAQEVLGWACEHGGPLGHPEVLELAANASKYYNDKADVAIAQLVRFGLFVMVELGEGEESYLVPRSLRQGVLSIVDHDLTFHARSYYETLASAGHLSFPDEGPHGWGGNALHAFRQLTVNWAAGWLEEVPPEYSVAVGMQIIDPDRSQPGTFASLLLDLSGETAFARQALRLWLALLDDPWTVALVEMTGGDSTQLVQHLATGVTGNDADVWSCHLFTLRAQLLLSLSLLPPGKWFPIEHLARLYHILIARSTLVTLGPDSLSSNFPYHALPDYGILIARKERRDAVKTWLERWLKEFVGVIGAAEVDDTGVYFRVHPDAFCVFRDSDLWFRTIWEDLSPIVGDDLDIWMPIPNDPGSRITDVATLWVSGERRVGIERNAHLNDLIWLARWARPVAEPGGFGFEFTEQSVSAALEDPQSDSEEMLLWLSIRLQGELSPAIRRLFPQSSSATDGPAEQWLRSASERLDALLVSLENWGQSPPGRLLEEIRRWGSAAAEPIMQRLSLLVERGAFEDPMCQHLCVLVGETNATSAVPLLEAIIQAEAPELLKHAAATACMRIGQPAFEPLGKLIASSSFPKDQRLIAAMGLSGLATLHTGLHDDIGRLMIRVISNSAFDSDLQTRIVLEMCRMGHPKSEDLIEQLQSEDAWLSKEWRPQDAMWLVRVSPCVWGSLLYSSPLAMLYLAADEADALAREAGVHTLLKKTGLTTDNVLYGRPRLKEH